MKLADNWVNLTGLDDLARTDPETAARLRRRYERAREALTAALVVPAVAEVPVAEWTCTACQGDLMWDTALGWVDWSSATPDQCPRNGHLGHVYSAAPARDGS